MNVRNDVLLQLLVALFKIIIDNHLVVVARNRRKRQLLLCLRQTLLNIRLLVRSTTPQTLLENLLAWRLDEDEFGVEVRLLDLLDTLHLNVEDADAALGRYVLDSGNRGAVVVAGELGVLDEGVLRDELEEGILGDKVVGLAVNLSSAGRAGGVCNFM